MLGLKLVDLLGDLSEFAKLEMKNNEENLSRVVKIKVKYEILLKYCKIRTMQGHNKTECKYYIMNRGGRSIEVRRSSKLMIGIP